LLDISIALMKRGSPFESIVTGKTAFPWVMVADEGQIDFRLVMKRGSPSESIVTGKTAFPWVMVADEGQIDLRLVESRTCPL
ncbi:MAG: hypothetical protein V2A53_04840, partial [bacterium]